MATAAIVVLAKRSANEPWYQTNNAPVVVPFSIGVDIVPAATVLVRSLPIDRIVDSVKAFYEGTKGTLTAVPQSR